MVAGDNAEDGVAVARNVLTANSGTIRDAGGNDAVLDHVAIATAAAHRVDGIVPTVMDGTVVDGGVAISSTGPYARGEAIVVTVTFSEAVTVDTTGGTPQIALTVGTATRQAVYTVGKRHDGAGIQLHGGRRRQR